MYFDRKALKLATKGMVNQGDPKGYLVSLVYLLATTGVAALVSMVIGLIMTDPVEELLAVYLEYMEVLASGAVSESALNAMTQQMAAVLAGPGVLVALLITIIISLYTMVVQFGYYDFALRRVRNQGSGYRDLFDWFHMAGKIIWLNVLQLIFIFLWALLFYFPGIVASYRYRMAIYCMLDDPDISALEAIRRSKKLMQGKKGELFVLDLSFLGWSLLVGLGLSAVQSACMYLPPILDTVVVTAAQCLGMMHLTTYMQYTNAGFYLFTLRKPAAPPVEERPMGFDPNGRPENPFDQTPGTPPPADEDWMK